VVPSSVSSIPFEIVCYEYFIDRTSANGLSANFALTEFSEVRRRSILGTSHQTSGGGIMLVVEKDAPLQLKREEGTAA
jgi:hypothetical protein